MPAAQADASAALSHGRVASWAGESWRAARGYRTSRFAASSAPGPAPALFSPLSPLVTHAPRGCTCPRAVTMAFFWTIGPDESALFPSSTLLTESDACCLIADIHVLMFAKLRGKARTDGEWMR
eukprot:521740-Prymnesium_polylepis.1